ncbi:MAG TPA: DUF1844 domain-containing protein [Pyrinomonadaceae bacterium]|nr:DUF1844 domain-containing protein [Pyrinomonadaceae bacterium]
MSEEKPTFKITDRRLFNADGTPREDVVREEEKTPPAPATETTAGGDDATAAGEPSSGVRAEASAPSPDAQTQTSPGGGYDAEADDPQEFLMIVEFIASFAAEALGMTDRPHPAGQPPVNLPLAKQCIDMLGTLERKTSGNLNVEERHVFDMILTQLRMQYVSLSGTQKTPAPPRGFSGGDITGGR